MLILLIAMFIMVDMLWICDSFFAGFDLTVLPVIMRLCSNRFSLCSAVTIVGAPMRERWEMYDSLFR